MQTSIFRITLFSIKKTHLRGSLHSGELSAETFLFRWAKDRSFIQQQDTLLRAANFYISGTDNSGFFLVKNWHSLNVESWAVLLIGFATASPNHSVSGTVVESVPLEQSRTAQATLQTKQKKHNLDTEKYFTTKFARIYIHSAELIWFASVILRICDGIICTENSYIMIVVKNYFIFSLWSF